MYAASIYLFVCFLTRELRVSLTSDLQYSWLGPSRDTFLWQTVEPQPLTGKLEAKVRS